MLEESKKLFEQKKVKNFRDPYLLINLSPLCDFATSLKKIKAFVKKYPHAQPLYFPGNILEDKKYFTKLQEHLPDIDLFDWTKAGLTTTMKCLYFAEAGI